jgi:hypothetical protein
MVYVLPLTEERHAYLETGPTFAEPVVASRRKQREIVLILRGKVFTHIARGTIARGSITLTDVQRLPRSLQWSELPSIIPKRLIAHAMRVFTTGGRLPPKTGAAILAALAYLVSDLRTYLTIA